MLSPGGEVPSGPPSRAGDRPRTTAVVTGVRHHPPGRTDKNLCRCFGAPACRVFPDHLITYRSEGEEAAGQDPEN